MDSFAANNTNSTFLLNQSSTTSASSSTSTSSKHHPHSNPKLFAKHTPNILFNPSPTTPAKCKQLKIKVHLASTQYVAGGVLDGKFEVVSLGPVGDLKLGEIVVELLGVEGEKSLSNSITACSSTLSSP
jgi:hypothetical protein